MLRLRRNWRQSDVADRARISPAAIGRHENGILGSLRALERHAGVFGLRVDVRVSGRGGELARITDEEHAAIVAALASSFREMGCAVEPEASFSEWGERGRVDLLVYEPVSGTVIIVEVKTELVDLQDLFGALNVRERLTRVIAERRGWQMRRCVTLLAVASTAANRETVRAHASLFDEFARRTLTPDLLRSQARRVLHWVPAPVAGRRSWLAGRRRVRRA